MKTSFINAKVSAEVTFLTYSFLPNREQWYACKVDIIDTKLLNLQTTKTKTRKIWKGVFKMFVLYISKINVLIRFMYVVYFSA